MVFHVAHIVPRFHRNLILPHWKGRNITNGSVNRPIVNIPPGSQIYAFGAPSQTKSPLISNLEWTVNSGEAWAVISGTGGRGKGVIFKASFQINPVYRRRNLPRYNTDSLRSHTAVATFTRQLGGGWWFIPLSGLCNWRSVFQGIPCLLPTANRRRIRSVFRLYCSLWCN